MKTLYCGIALAIHATVLQAEPLPAVDCILNPSQEIDLSSYVPGVLTQVYVQRGQAVAVGEPIAEIDSRVEIASVVLAEARAEIQSELESSRINLGYDRLTHRRLSDLYSSRAVSEQDKEQTERAVKLSSATLKQAEELRRIRELELKRAQALLEQRTVRSPIAGVIQRNLKQIGEYVDEEPIVRVVSLDPLSVETMVPIQLFGKIAPGMQAEVFAEIDPQTPRQATVVAVDPVGDVGSSAFGIQLTMANPDHQLPAGIKCDLRFLEPPAVAERATATPASNPPVQPDVETVAKLTQPLVASAASVTESSALAIQPVAAAGPTEVQPGEQKLMQLSESPVLVPDVQASAPPAAAQSEVSPTETITAQSAETDQSTENVVDWLELGLFKAGEAEQILATLTQRQVAYRTEAVQRIERVGYIILQSGEQAVLLKQVAALQAAGVEDVAYMSHGPYKGQVSLGVFYTAATAQRRVDEIQALGYPAESRERRKRKAYLQISVQALAGDSRLAGLQR